MGHNPQITIFFEQSLHSFGGTHTQKCTQSHKLPFFTDDVLSYQNRLQFRPTNATLLYRSVSSVACIWKLVHMGRFKQVKQGISLCLSAMLLLPCSPKATHPFSFSQTEILLAQVARKRNTTPAFAERHKLLFIFIFYPGFIIFITTRGSKHI